MSVLFKKLRKLRKLNDITLMEVAEKTGLSMGYLNRIERGYVQQIKNDMKRKALVDYIKALEHTTMKDSTITNQLQSIFKNNPSH